jgi:transcriptional regulator with XRE-family HTH domain
VAICHNWGGEEKLLGERLVELRKEKKLTQEDIAKKLHLTRSTYAQYEVDRRVPEYATLQKLADYFNVSIDYLVGRSNDRKAGEPRDAAELLNNFLEFELTDEEIMERMTFKVDNMVLSDEEVLDFIAFVRAKRFMKKEQPASASKADEP